MGVKWWEIATFWFWQMERFSHESVWKAYKSGTTAASLRGHFWGRHAFIISKTVKLGKIWHKTQFTYEVAVEHSLFIGHSDGFSAYFLDSYCNYPNLLGFSDLLKIGRKILQLGTELCLTIQMHDFRPSFGHFYDFSILLNSHFSRFLARKSSNWDVQF